MRSLSCSLMVAVSLAALPSAARAEGAPAAPAPAITAPTAARWRVNLGASATEVVAQLGYPNVTTTYAHYVIWHYTGAGLSVAIHEDYGVIGLFLVTRDAGNLDGVQVGDSFGAAVAAWGTPYAWEENIAIFVLDGSNVLVEVVDSEITTIGLAVPEFGDLIS